MEVRLIRQESGKDHIHKKTAGKVLSDKFHPGWTTS